jgi:hypothetical protein
MSHARAIAFDAPPSMSLQTLELQTQALRRAARMREATLRIAGCSRIAAMVFSSTPQFGQCTGPRSNTRSSNLARLERAGRWNLQRPRALSL